MFDYCNAQTFEKFLKGTVLDAKTGLPVSSVTLISSRSGAITNAEGHFSIDIEKSDTIIFTHVNYHRIQLYTSLLNDDMVKVILTPKTIVLDEIIISDIPSVEEFKSDVLQIRIAPSANEINAVHNFQNTNLIFMSGYIPPMNSEDNYKNFLKGPQPFNLFSTDKTKGIIGFIHSLKKPKYKPKFTLNNFDSQFKFNVSDSTQDPFKKMIEQNPQDTLK